MEGQNGTRSVEALAEEEVMSVVEGVLVSLKKIIFGSSYKQFLFHLQVY